MGPATVYRSRAKALSRVCGDSEETSAYLIRGACDSPLVTGSFK